MKLEMEKSEMAGEARSPPALLTLTMIREHYLPIGERTVFRLISAGQFPKADIGIGGRIRLWKRQTIEAWIAKNSERQ
jgi:predicted DNA-binding transcriptional regulator AlpA